MIEDTQAVQDPGEHPNPGRGPEVEQEQPPEPLAIRGVGSFLGRSQYSGQPSGAGQEAAARDPAYHEPDRHAAPRLRLPGPALGPRARNAAWVGGTVVLALAALGAGTFLASLSGQTAHRHPAIHRVTSGPPSPSATPASTGLHMVNPPPAVAGGLARDRAAEQGAAASLSNMLDRLVVEANVSAPGVTAVYDVPGRKDIVTGSPKQVNFIGLDWGPADPASFLDTYLHDATNGLSNVHFVHVSPGMGGGSAECATFFNGVTGEWSLCGWATTATVGIMDTPLRDASVSELAAIMRQMRADLERG